MIGQDIMKLESRSARVAATLDARPEMGAIWRRMVGLAEAGASLSLEDISVAAADIQRPPLGLDTIKGEPQAAHVANSVYRFMIRHGSALDRPSEIFDRAIQSSRLTNLVDEDQGGRIDYPDQYERMDWDIARFDFASAVKVLRPLEGPVILKSLAIARVAALTMPERMPIAERLIFQAFESDIRKSTVLSDPIIGHPIEGAEHRIDTHWVLTPSLALSQNGFRAWSPISRSGWSDLITRLDKTLEREVGRLAQVNAWADRLAKFRGPTKRSLMGSFAQVIKISPIVSTSSVAHALGSTDRAALKLITAAQEAHLLTPLTRRRAYRIWAAPPLADLLQEQSKTPKLQSIRDRIEKSDYGAEPAPRRLTTQDSDFERRIEDIMAEIDTAGRNYDEVIEKYRTGKLTT